MALKIQLRNGTAAQWTSTNPVLTVDEPGIENDTGRFKVGDGVTAWNSLAYRDIQGGTQTTAYRSFGDGSDGTVTISSGTTTLTRDMYYDKLTMSGTGKIVTSGFKIFCKTYLDLSAAAVGAIQWNGNAGNNASGITGGAIPAAQPGGALGDISQGGTGATATTGAGPNGTAGTTGNGNSGYSGQGGAGGTSAANGAGGTGGVARTPAINNPINRYETNFLAGNVLNSGGPGGGGGGAGSGDNTNDGGAGGSGGNGGGIVAIYANTIIKSSVTPAGVIQANGGVGGNGSNSAGTGVVGGGAGGGGGGGGWVYICRNTLIGPTISALIQANGGNGGNGGNAFGSGSTAGAGGNAGSGGRITIINVPTSATTSVLGNHDLTQQPEQVGYKPVVGTTSVVLVGGNGGFNGVRTATL